MPTVGDHSRYVEELPDCNKCGACCVTDLEYGRGGWVQLTTEDTKRLPEKYQLKVVHDPEIGCDRLGVLGTPKTGYRCVALQGTVNKKTACKAYEHRPTKCRTFERGSADCRKERANWLFGRYQR